MFGMTKTIMASRIRVELPIEGVKLTLTGTGNGTTVLDPATGMEFMNIHLSQMVHIFFDGLVPGDYKLTFDTPADLNPTKANEPGVNDTDDSDADPNTGMTEFTFLESGEYDLPGMPDSLRLTLVICRILMEQLTQQQDLKHIIIHNCNLGSPA
jgi:hypothetical protein